MYRRDLSILHRRPYSPYPPDQVANALDSTVDLTPDSQAPAEATRAGWDALRPGQSVPLINERVPPDDDIFRDE